MTPDATSNDKALLRHRAAMRMIGDLAQELHCCHHVAGDTWWACPAPSCRNAQHFLDSEGYGPYSTMWHG